MQEPLVPQNWSFCQAWSVWWKTLGTWPGGQPWRASFSLTFAFSLPPFLLSPSFYKGVWALAQPVLVMSSQNLTCAKPLATFLQVHNITLGGSVSTACCPLPSQAPLSLGFPRQEDWSGLPFPSPRDLLDPGTEPRPPALQANSLPFETPGKPPSPWNLLETLPQTQEVVFRYLRRERPPSQLATLSTRWFLWPMFSNIIPEKYNLQLVFWQVYLTFLL